MEQIKEVQDEERDEGSREDILDKNAKEEDKSDFQSFNSDGDKDEGDSQDQSSNSNQKKLVKFVTAEENELIS